MPEAPPRKSTATEAAVCAGILGLTAGTYFIVREFTDLSPYAAMLTAFVVGSFGFIGLALVYIKLRLHFLTQSPAAKHARDEFIARFDADQKELGLDKESKVFAEKDVKELTRKMRELELTPGYMKAGESERDRMMKELMDRHLEETKAKVEEVSKRAAGRVEALREYRALEQRSRGGETLSEEDQARMSSLKAKAYSGR
jgi:hypothetical protein